MSQELHLMTRTALLQQVRALVRDTAAQRWSDTEMQLALNQALASWAGRVSWPLIVEQAWTERTYTYPLPAYMSEMVQPQWQDEEGRWHDFMAYTVEQGQLRFFNDPGSHSGRLIAWMMQGMLPIGTTTLTSNIDSNTDWMLISYTNPVPWAGWVRVNSEWMRYVNMGWSDDGVTLLNLTRGLYGSAPASHALGDVVEWGIAMPAASLIEQLGDQVAGYLHRLYLSDGSAQERSQHERMVAYYDQRTMDFWRRWTPRAPRVRIEEQRMTRVSDDWTHQAR